MSTGEALSTILCNRWLALYPEIPIINAYGPTECADDVLQHVIDRVQPENFLIPAGTPLANSQIYILDSNMKIVPPQVVGEIYVGGIGVGLGYLKDAEKTKKSFLPDPFSKDSTAKIYKTGDLGAWKNDGTVVYLGRKDTQIKLHGARIELSEIDAILNRCPLIKQAVTVYDKTRNILVAFCIPGNGRFDTSGIREYCLMNLPSFMRPSVLKPIEYVPRGSSGKIDRKILLETAKIPEVRLPQKQNSMTKKEMQLKEIWEIILGITGISDNSNFFEMGGNSLNTIRLVALARKNGMALSPQDVFKYPVLSDMANQCEAKPSPDTPVRTNIKVLSTGEKQFLNYSGSNKWAIDSAFLLELSPGLEPQIIQDAITCIWDQYIGLRSRFFRNKNNLWSKEIYGSSSVPFSMIELNESLTTAQFKMIVSGYRERLFSEDSPLFDVMLFRYRKQNILLARGHYLACDFVSWQIVFDEFNILLKNKVHILNNRGKVNQLDSIIDYGNNHGCHLNVPIGHLENYFSDENYNQDMEALLVMAVNSFLSEIFQPHEYQILLGQNGRTRESLGMDMIGRWSYMVGLPEIKKRTAGNLHDTLSDIKNIILNSEQFDPASEYTEYMINIDFLGTLPVNYRSGVAKLERGTLSAQKNQLFPLELIFWIEGNTLSAEFAIDENRFPFDGKALQNSLKDKLIKCSCLL
jgi:hypothetical protein